MKGTSIHKERWLCRCLSLSHIKRRRIDHVRIIWSACSLAKEVSCIYERALDGLFASCNAMCNVLCVFHAPTPAGTL